MNFCWVVGQGCRGQDVSAEVCFLQFSTNKTRTTGEAANTHTDTPGPTHRRDGRQPPLFQQEIVAKMEDLHSKKHFYWTCRTALLI